MGESQKRTDKTMSGIFHLQIVCDFLRPFKVGRITAKTMGNIANCHYKTSYK
jgi:hypothetical protein